MALVLIQHPRGCYSCAFEPEYVFKRYGGHNFVWIVGYPEFWCNFGWVRLVAGAPSEVADGRRGLSVSSLAFWADDATLVNMLVSYLSAAIFSPLGGANSAVCAIFVST